MRDEPLSSGIGVLKFMFGTYVLILVTIFGFSAKQHKVEEDPNAIEFEMQDDFVVLSYNDKVFPVDSKSYDEFMDSDKQETLMIDTLDNNNTQVIINKDSLQELKRCSSYDEACEYISELNANKGFRR